MPDLLLEIGAEELPAGYLEPALEALGAGFRARMGERGFALPAEAVGTTGSPRRLILWARELPEKSPERSERLQGPPADRAFDAEGRPTKAAEGFARKCGVPVEALRVEGTHVVAEVRRGGGSAAEALMNVLPELVAALPFPKSMRWLPGSKVSFARPVRSLLCLLGKEVVPFPFADLVAGRESHGHPFHAPEGFSLRDARYWEFIEVLRGRKVLADLVERRERVRACAAKAAEKAGGRLYNHDGVADRLVAEVANLVEWPGAVIGRFDPAVCRELPEEVTVAAQTLHQRYFPVEDASGRLLPAFVAIANRDPRGGGKAAVIRAGNERVLRARLADARFFWREDKKRRLEDRLAALEGVVFHEQLGSVRQKVERTSRLAKWLALESGHEAGVAEAAARAALLSKCDLVTKMVFEFPELQGTMGRYYAREDGEPSSVRQGIEEHYLPRTAALELPKTQVGRLAALADKFDSLVGGFAAGLAPTGNKDPYALRRAALGVIAIVRGARLFRSGPELRAVILKAREFYRQQDMLLETGDELAQRLLGFFRDRLEIALVEELRAREPAGGLLRPPASETSVALAKEVGPGVPADALAGKVGVVNVVRAVLAAGFGNLAELDARLAAVAAFAERSDFAGLCTVVERARNIVRKTAQLANRVEPEEAALVADEERELHRIYAGVAPRFRLMLAEGDLAGASELYLKSFAAPLHLFFEKVFVNVEDDVLRRNRLALLAAIYRLYAEAIADLAECAGQAKA